MMTHMEKSTNLQTIIPSVFTPLNFAFLAVHSSSHDHGMQLIAGGILYCDPPQSMDVDSDKESLMSLHSLMDWDKESVFTDHDANDDMVIVDPVFDILIERFAALCPCKTTCSLRCHSW
jgi:hypothetical protein